MEYLKKKQDKREENILCDYLFRDKIIQNCLKIDATH